MIKRLRIKNFRSIQSANVEFGPLTILYGPTSSGKSSLLYAPLVLRNFILNPNQPADGFFNLGFMDLGGFNQCIFDHKDGNISIQINYKLDKIEGSYSLEFKKESGLIESKQGILSLSMKVPIPYGVNQTEDDSFERDGHVFTVSWNGVTFAVNPKVPSKDATELALFFSEQLNTIPEQIKTIDIAPHRRGFFKPIYTPVPISLSPTSEDEVASVVINDQHMAGRISTLMEEIFDRDFRTYTAPGTSTVSFLITDKKARIPVLLVNEGFGVNQILYLLIKLYKPNVRTVLIEEPEVHLHPKILRNFARILVEFVNDEKKQIIVTTHSEMFLSAILEMVSEEMIKPEDVKCYLVTKEKKNTLFEEQVVSKNGQIEGGLSSFSEADLEDLKRFLAPKSPS